MKAGLGVYEANRRTGFLLRCIGENRTGEAMERQTILDPGTNRAHELWKVYEVRD